jgi:hypothetical protein
MMEINKIGRSSFEHVLGYFLHMANRLGNQPQGTKMETPAVSSSSRATVSSAAAYH